MARVNKNSAIVVLVIIGIIVFAGAITQKHTNFLPFSILTSGNLHNTDCSFLTNINSSNWNINDYNQGWIALDVYGYGQKNVFGYLGDYDNSSTYFNSSVPLTTQALGGFSLSFDSNDYLVFVYSGNTIHGYKLNYNVSNVDLSCGNNTNSNICTSDSNCPQLGIACSQTYCPFNKCINGVCTIINTVNGSSNNTVNITNQTACPMIAQLCPDGSSVSMTAVNGQCVWQTCPVSNNSFSWLTKEIWNINGFSITLWMALLGLVVLIMFIILLMGGGA